MKNKDKIITNYKQRIQHSISDKDQPELLDRKSEAVLLGELQIAQLELEMQNDELSMAVSLLESERTKFEGFFNLAPTAYFIVDHIGVVAEVNQIGLKLFELPKTNLVGQRLQSFVQEEDYELFYSFLKSLEPEGNKGSITLRLITFNRRMIYARMEGIALVDHFQGKLQFYLTIVDITENRLAELELKDTTKRLELTLSASGIGTWSVDTATELLYLDEYSLSLLGIRKLEFDGHHNHFFELVHPEERATVKQVVLNAFREATDVELEFRIYPKNGQLKNVMLKGLKVEMDDARPHMAGIIVDITKAKRLEETKRESENEKQKLVYETTFVAQEKERERISSVLHDSVCQLLYGIRLNLQQIKLKPQVDIENIHKLIAQAIKETRDLSYELTPSILRDFGLVAAIVEMVERLITKNLKINTNISKHVNKLSIDLQLSIFRILQELLNNCIKHSQATKAEIVIGIEGKEVVTIYTDNGVGFQQDSTKEMKGSGLRAIKNRIFLMNGSIDIKSSPKGTKIIFTFKAN